MDDTTRRPAAATRARHWGSSWAAVSLLLVVHPLSAQTPEAAHAERLAAVLEGIPPDHRIRFETGAPEFRLEGRYVGTDEGRLAMATADGVIYTRLAEIDRLWTRGRSTGMGALIGAAGGLLIGATYGALISDVACAETSCTTLGVAAAGAGIGAAGGAAVGALVGLALPSWKLRFP